MRFQTVRDILDFVRGFHERAGRLYAAVADQSAQQKVRWMLDWLSAHERRFATAIEQFEQAPENAHLLREWLQYVPQLEQLPLELPALKPELNLDDAVALAIAFDEYLVRFYDAVLSTCGSRDLCEMFRKLQDQERAEERAVARNLAQLRDV